MTAVDETTKCFLLKEEVSVVQTFLMDLVELKCPR